MLKVLKLFLKHLFRFTGISAFILFIMITTLVIPWYLFENYGLIYSVGSFIVAQIVVCAIVQTLKEVE